MESVTLLEDGTLQVRGISADNTPKTVRAKNVVMAMGCQQVCATGLCIAICCNLCLLIVRASHSLCLCLSLAVSVPLNLIRLWFSL